MSRADSGSAARVWAATMTVAWFGIMAAPVQAQDAAAAAAEPTAEQIALGEQIFTGKVAGGTCWGCHAKNGKGTANAPDLTDKTWLSAEATLASIEGVVSAGVPKPKKFKVAMPPMGGGKLTPDEVKAVAAYVYSLSKKAKK